MRRYFISDLHLQQERPEITAALLYFLEQIAQDGDELYLLGDIFEAWIGDDSDDPVIEPVAAALADYASSRRIYLMPGNRDFLFGSQAAERLHARLLGEQYQIELPQGRALLMHGDELCSADWEYQQLRLQLRSASWQQQFLSRSLEERKAIARQLRAASQQAGSMKAEAIMDVCEASVSAVMQQANVSLLIHGHTHRPAVHQRSNGQQRIVLGDWGEHGWYLVSDPQRLELIRFTPPS